MVSQAAIPARASRGPLRRRTEHRLVAGVAGGIADWLNAPVAFIRFVGFFAVAWVWPWGLVLYAGAALLLPAAGRNRPDWDNLVGAGRLGLLYGVAAFGLPPIALNDYFEGDPGVWIATYALLGTGAAVFLSADYRRGRPLAADEARNTVLAALPVAACAIVVAAGIVLVPDVRWERVAPLVAIAGGLTLLLARRREFVAPALLALGAAVVIVASGARLDGGVGDLRLRSAATDDESIVARRAAGDVTIDLRRLRGRTDPVVVEASVGTGALRVTVPTGAPLEIDARVGRGSISTGSTQTNRVKGFSHDVHGFDERATGVHPGLDGFAPVRVIADVGSGEIDIWRGR